jgi:hypothetical protein
VSDAFDRSDEPEAADLASEAEVSCPYCGETITLSLDPGGGMAQEYIEDCQVCCRPWRVQLSYDEEGMVTVTVEPVE